MQKRILIVDDEPAIRDMVAYASRKGECDPAQAGDAREAHSSIAERVPDLILLDWKFPGTSGLELARRWRREALTRDIPIIMLTARGEEDERVGGLEAGVDDYVVKPSARELLARIRAVMRRSREDDEDGSVRSEACASMAPRTGCSPDAMAPRRPSQHSSWACTTRGWTSPAKSDKAACLPAASARAGCIRATPTVTLRP